MDVYSRALNVITEWREREYSCESQKTAWLQKLIITAIKEQDRDTRHACAEAVLKCNRDMSDECIWLDEAHDACINVDAV